MKWKARHLCGLVLAVVSLVSIAAIPFLSFSGRIDVMLPENSGLHDVFSFLKDIQVSDKVLVTLSLRDGSSDSDVLCSAADRYVSLLDSRLAVPLNTAFRQDTIAQDFKRLISQLPDYTEPYEFDELRQLTSYGGVSLGLTNLLKRLQTPEGMFAGAAARSDPMDWNGRMVKKIMGMLTSFGYRAIPVQGHLMDPERKHLLIVLQTPVQMMDVPGVRSLLKHLDECAKQLPPAVQARLVCAHLHTLGNEKIIRRDIGVTSVAVVVVFCILFFGVYRDWRSGYVVLIPFLASLPALALAAGVFEPFSALVVGFGSVIAGITIDYAIHAYVVSRSPHREINLKRIRLPVILSALTTLCVFVAFCFSTIPAYRQLGCFASLAILVSLVYALAGLPHFIPVREPKGVEPPSEPPRLFKPAVARLVLLFSALAYGLGLLGLHALRFDANVSRLDGTPAAVISEENRAVGLWGGGEARSAIISVEASSEEDGLQLNDQLYNALKKAGMEAHSISSLSPLYPSQATRRARRAAWRSFWNDGQVAMFKENMRRASAEMDFSDDAFSAFWALFDQWRMAETRPGEPIRFLLPLRERFIHPYQGESGLKAGQRFRVVTFVPDDPAVLATVHRASRDIPSVKVISRLAFSERLSAAFVQEVTWVTELAGVLIVLVTVVLMRRPRMILFALLPPIAGVLWGSAVMAFLGRPLDVSNLIAGIIVLGLCIDYGICMVFAYRDGIQRDVFKAVTLSAVTTILGAGVLLLAKHPALFSIGLTLVAGVSAGYLCAWLTLRALYSLNMGAETSLHMTGTAKGLSLFAVLSLLWTAGCQTTPFPEPSPFRVSDLKPEEVPLRFHRSLASQFEEQNALVFRYRWMEMAAIGVASVDTGGRSLAVTCMTPLGVKIFDVVCTNGLLARSFVMPALADKAGPLATSAGEDLMHAYFDLLPPATATWRQTKTRLVFEAQDERGVTEYHYAWQEGMLAEKIRMEKRRMIWRVEYRAYSASEQGLVPTAMRIVNGERHYSIDVSRCVEESK